MEKTGIGIKEYYENLTGKNIKEIEIVPYKDIFTGKNLEKCKNADFKSKRGSCHYNAGMVMGLNLDGWDITFCEGLYKGCIPHCWNKVTNRETGESYYVDFTIGAGKAYLVEEWDNDIIKLFNARKQAFVPFENGDDMTEKNKKARAIFVKHYPKYGSTSPAGV